MRKIGLKLLAALDLLPTLNRGFDFAQVERFFEECFNFDSTRFHSFERLNTTET